MRVEDVGPGYAVCADSTKHDTVSRVLEITGPVPLVIADPPYGNVLPDYWDTTLEPDTRFAQWMVYWTQLWQRSLLPNGAFYVWGGIGTPTFRPFFRYLVRVEEETPLRLANLITWKKRRAYGVTHNYLFTREECAYLINGPDVKKPRCFNIPLLEEKRGYSGFKARYPAKSEFYRRTNVWTDVTEVMQGKVHVAQKAKRVIEVPIEVHTQSGEWVIDPFAGSGTTGLAAMRLGRRFVVIEKDEQIFETMLDRLRNPPVNERGRVVVSGHGSDKEVTHGGNDVDLREINHR